MIRKITLRFGAAPGEPPLTFEPGALTIFVGPNNSGKSLALRDIARYVITPHPKGSLIFRRLRRRTPREPFRSQILERIRKEVEGWIDLETAQAGGAAPSAGDGQADRQAQELAALITLLKLGSGLADLVRTHLDLRRLAKFLQIKDAPSGGQFNFDVHIPMLQELARWMTQQRKERGLDRVLLQLLRKRVLSYEADAALLRPGVLLLDGRGRLNSVLPTQPPQYWGIQDEGNHLANLLKKGKARAEFRRIVHDAIQLYPVLDTTSFRQTILKLSEQEPRDDIEKRHDPEALRFFRRAKDIQEYSDGVRSFVGLVAAVLSGDYQVMLIDEPEAFLHPSLVRKLGSELHRLAQRRQGHVFAATHSPEFVTGCLQAGHDVNIIRLTYRNKTPSARLLPVESLGEMMREPLLRSTGMLSALSHEGAIICEADADRALYQEINDRLRKQREGLDGIAFLNAHGKQAIFKVLGPLRVMGIRAAAIVDCDLIGSRDDHQKLLRAVGADQLVNMIGTMKRTLLDAFVAQAGGDREARALIKRRGIRALTPDLQDQARAGFFEPLASYGIFVVPGGELETWLENLVPLSSVGGEKSEWITTVFDRMGSDPGSRDYVRPTPPGGDDIWDFMRRVTRWISSPLR